MERKVGTISRGIRCPIIREGDNLVDITVNSVFASINILFIFLTLFVH